MKVPKPRKLTSGNWFIQLRLGGESVSVTERTEKQCVKAAQFIKAEYQAGKREKSAQAKKPITLTQAIDKYIKARENMLSPSTIRGYRVIQKHRFQSAMNKPLNEMEKEDWQRLCNEESKKYTAKTLTNTWRFISSVITEETGIRYTIRLPQIIQKERPFLEPEQISLFISAVKDTEVEIPALLALCSLRISEIRALRWVDIDFEKQIVHVRGSAVYDENTNLVYKAENKNSSSRRDIPMIPQLLRALKQSKRDGNYVVALHSQVIYTRINQICKANNLPFVGLHGLRHSFASLAYHLGMPAKIAMEIGGWANDQTMQRIYTHVARSDRLKNENAMLEYYKNLETLT